MTVTGKVVAREMGTVNPRLPTGEVELQAAEVEVQSGAEVLPIQVAGDESFPGGFAAEIPLHRPSARKMHRT